MEIHFLSIGRVLRPNHTFVDVLQIGVEIDSGNSESQMKSQRLGAVWGQKKHHSPVGMAITNKLPGLLDGKTGAQMTVNNDGQQDQGQSCSANFRDGRLGQRQTAHRPQIEPREGADLWPSGYLGPILHSENSF
jgi:hypothetical protein